MVLGLGLQVADLLAADDGGADFLGLVDVAVRAPFDAVDLTLADETLVESVTLHVGDSQELVL